jgi:site-specific DNA recombinase
MLVQDSIKLFHSFWILLLINSFPVEQEIEKIVSVGGYKYTGRGEQFIDPAVRPINDNDLPNSKAEYDKVGDEIYRLRDEKQKVQLDIIGRDELKKRIDDMSEFLKKQSTALAEYDEQLVRRLIEKVTVFEDKFIVEFKSGLTVDVDE